MMAAASQENLKALRNNALILNRGTLTISSSASQDHFVEQKSSVDRVDFGLVASADD